MAKDTSYHGWTIPETGDTDYDTTLDTFWTTDLDTEVIEKDTKANRPAAGTADRWFLATDEPALYRDDGSAWNKIGGKDLTGETQRAANFEAEQSTSTPYALHFNNDTDTGLYRNAADVLHIATGGTDAARVKSDQSWVFPSGNVRVDDDREVRFGTDSDFAFVFDATAGELQLVDDPGGTPTDVLTLAAGANPALGRTLDVNGNDLEDGTSAIYDASNSWVPLSILEANSVTVAGNSVTLGNSTAVSGKDLSDSSDIAYLNESESVSSSWTFNADQVVSVDHGTLDIGDAVSGQSDPAFSIHRNDWNSGDYIQIQGTHAAGGPERVRIAWWDSSAAATTDIAEFLSDGVVKIISNELLAQDNDIVTDATGTTNRAFVGRDAGTDIVKFGVDSGGNRGFIYNAVDGNDWIEFRNSGHSNGQEVAIENELHLPQTTRVDGDTQIIFGNADDFAIEHDETAARLHFISEPTGTSPSVIMEMRPSGQIDFPSGSSHSGSFIMDPDTLVKWGGGDSELGTSWNSTANHLEYEDRDTSTLYMRVPNDTPTNSRVKFPQGVQSGGSLAIIAGNDIVDDSSTSRLEIRSGKTTIGSNNSGTGRISLFDHSAGVDTLRVQEGGDVQVVNRDFDVVDNQYKVGGNTIAQSVPASGQASLSSGTAIVDTAISATDATFTLALGIDDPNADAKVTGRLFWDDSAGTYKIEIVEDGTSQNPTVNYDVIRVR